MAENQNPQNGNLEILTRAGATLEVFQAFARAAVRFYESPIRQELSSADLIRVEAPAGDPDFRFAAWTDLGPPRTALFFFPSVAAWEDEEEEDERTEDEEPEPWRVSFEPFLFVHPDRQRLWDTDGSARTADGLCPSLFRLSLVLAPGEEDEEEEDEEPLEELEILADDTRLRFVEGLLLALADTTVAELDAGRWEKTVPAAAGETRYVLSLPAVVDPRPADEGPVPSGDPRLHERSLRDLHRHLEEQDFASVDEANAFLDRLTSLDQIPHPKPATPAERAQELIDEALVSHGRRRSFLARRALEIWPDCVEAYVLLAEARQSAEEELELYRQGMAAGERTLGPVLEESAGELWEVLAARPYLRALHGVVAALFRMGRLEESAATAHELLRLDALDHQEVGQALIAIRLRQGRMVDAWELLDRGDGGAWSCYTRALLAYSEQGDSEEARSWLRRGVGQSSVIGLCLLEMTVVPGRDSAFALPPQIVSALGYQAHFLAAWRAVPGALRWMESLLFTFDSPTRPGKRKGSSRKKPKRKPGRKRR